MCGIAGAVNFKLNYEGLNASMGHRGPDARHGFERDNVDFYHLRLSIVDIAGGKQPMHLDDRYTIIFNGEIYNHQELRTQFNLDCNSPSDTETLLFLYRKMGAEFLNHVDGMFALAIYDAAEKRIFIARDRAGKKPLYLYKDEDKIIFTSELNGLKSQIDLEIEPEHFYAYLRIGSFSGQQTPYKKVQELNAGHYFTIDCNTQDIKSTKWWDISDFYAQSCSDNNQLALENVDTMLHTAVKRRIISSDLEVGSFLSGGIDSGLVTAIASEYNNRLKTFTVSFDGEYDEAPLAKIVADKYQTQHTEIKINFSNLRNDLDKIISNYGEPFFDSSAVPSYYVSEEAKKHVTVILNGDGADELFGGYRRYVPFAKYDFFKKNSILKATAEAGTSILPFPNNKKSKYNFLYRLMSFASKENLELYLAAGVDIFEGHEKAFSTTEGSDYLKTVREVFTPIAKSKMSGLKKIMDLDFKINLFSDLLVKMDIANMAHSLEGRSPFLSKELLEYAPMLPDNLKISGSTTKYLLRTLSAKYLPKDLQNQPKRGFEIPLKNWVEYDLKDMIYDLLEAPQAMSRQFLDQKFIDSLLAEKDKYPAEKRAKMLWTLMSLELWNNNVYKNKVAGIAQ